MRKSEKMALGFGAGALALCLGMNGYHYSLEGARGLYEWNNTPLFRSLILMGFIPLTVAILALPLGRLKSRIPGLAVRVLSMVLSVAVGLASVGLAAFLVVGPRLVDMAPARLELINPIEGLRARGTPVMSAGGAQAGGATGDTSGGATAVGAAPAAPLLRLSFSSDPHWGVETADGDARLRILAGIAARKPDAFFMLGDTVEDGSKASQLKAALADLEASIPGVPVRPLLGNHDALFGGQYLYRKVFFPADLESDSGSPYYYSIDAGPALVVVLDLPWGTEMYGRRQRAWLEKTLAAADPAKPVIALSHSFFWASGYDDPVLDKPWYDHRENIPAITPLFEKYGVDLVVSGHNHYEEFLEHAGVAYAVIGAMGGIPDPEPEHVSPASRWIAVGTHGWLDVDVFADSLSLAFRNAGGAVIHAETVALRK